MWHRRLKHEHEQWGRRLRLYWRQVAIGLVAMVAMVAIASVVVVVVVVVVVAIWKLLDCWVEVRRNW